MRYLVGVLAGLAVLPITLAGNVYSRFTDLTHVAHGWVDFEVGNPGCFSVEDAAIVRFQQSVYWDEEIAGPYCLWAYNQPGCGEGHELGHQVFQRMLLEKDYPLHKKLRDAASYRWVNRDDWNTGPDPWLDCTYYPSSIEARSEGSKADNKTAVEFRA